MNRVLLIMAVVLIGISSHSTLSQQTAIPKEVPPRRSTQLSDGFGVNLPLPREPRLSWNQVGWTRLFGVKWVRLGQYENTSDKTSWDWIEQTPGVYHVLPEVDEAVRSLADNGISIELQLCYGNPLYHGDRVSRPKHIEPAPPTLDRRIILPIQFSTGSILKTRYRDSSTTRVSW